MSEISGQRKRRSLIGRGPGDSAATGRRDGEPATPAPAESRGPIPGPVPAEGSPISPPALIEEGTDRHTLDTDPIAKPVTDAWIDAPAQRRGSQQTPKPTIQRVSPPMPMRDEDVDAPPLSSVRVKTTPPPVPSRTAAPEAEPVVAAAAEPAPVSLPLPGPPAPTPTPSPARRRDGVLDSGVNDVFDDFTKRAPPTPSDMGPIAPREASPGIVLGAVSGVAIVVALLAWYFLG